MEGIRYSRHTIACANPAMIPKKHLPLGPVMVDVAGTALTDHERQRLRHLLVGGVILFARNFHNRRQLTALCQEIHAVRDAPLLIAVDHEGGRVQRFRNDGFTKLPAMAQLGRAWMHDPLRAMRLATAVGYVMGAELRACGVDFSFTPVLDLDYGVSQVIGDRAFHRDARVVTMLARALIQGLGHAGMAACGKHFPGHGAVHADSHHAIPVDERALEDILREDAAPYAWLGDLVLPAVMPAHVIYPEVDAQPAGFSRVWLQDVLRTHLQYDGVIFSDDLTMQGATVAGDILARAKAALMAGCDMVLVCNHPDLADDLLQRLRWRVTQTSLRRMQRLVPVPTTVPTSSTRATSTWRALQSDARYRHATRDLQSDGISG